MHPNVACLERFYAAFQQRDARAMAVGYHADVHFSDEVFPDLHGPDAGAMWAMLCARGKDLRVEASAFTADDHHGRAHWEAWYTFSGTGRMVHNIIEAEFTFRDGLIVRHVDRFDFARWARQALGPLGLLGAVPILRGRLRAKVRATAARSLAAWMARTP